MMERKQFEENLFLYGANVHQWPEETKKAGLEAMESSSEMQALVAEHEQFEKTLKVRRYEESSKNLAQRIISVSLQQRQKTPFSLGSFIGELLNEFRIPRSALAALFLMVILTFMIGFVMGFSNLSGSSVLNTTEETNLQAFLFDEGDII
jgi:uncharacterized membrane protein YbjE (DUF340 family)